MMEKGIVISALVAMSSLVCSCGNKSNAPRADEEFREPEVTEQTEQTDSSAVQEEPSSAETEEKTPSSVSAPSPQRTPSRRDYRREEADNMRGFDPASEDDMDDNGMSRYMENYDDEGWD